MPVVAPVASLAYVQVQTLDPGSLFHPAGEHATARPLSLAFQAGPGRIAATELEGENAFTLKPIGSNTGHYVIRRPASDLTLRVGTARYDAQRVWQAGSLYLTPEGPLVLISGEDRFGGDPGRYFLSLTSWEVTREYPTRYACVTDWALLDRTARGDELIVQVGDPG